ncbi:MAG TPA: bacillithiol system redox-active protein YtxJ [Phnomibacter sp.]|nr:bacillithiol system redox-active protein YtxJ [Phnomibacter sp.]
MQFPWIELHHLQQVDDLLRHSYSRPQIIYKHSHRCNLSSISRRRLEQNGPFTPADHYFIDVIAQRVISRHLSDALHVPHESPQVLVVVNGECIYDESHFGITALELAEAIDPKTKG